MNKLLHLAFGLMAVTVLFGSTQLHTNPAVAALDCTETVNLKIYITDDGRPNVNQGFLSLGGAYVDFSDNIQTGSFESIRYYDNQSTGSVRDDNDRRGIIEERTACRDLDTIGVTVTLGFRENLDCTVIGDATQSVDLYEDAVVEFFVDDCEAVAPTATPTKTAVPATATATVAPATATPAPLPTVQPSGIQPALTQCVDGRVVLSTQGCPVPTAPAAPVASQSPSRITAPNTGDGGLLR